MKGGAGNAALRKLTSTLQLNLGWQRAAAGPTAAAACVTALAISELPLFTIE